MSLLDILACPRCRTAVVRKGDALLCVTCAHPFPIVDGVPVMLLDPRDVHHEGDLIVRDFYEPPIQRLFDSLPRDRIVLEVGAGERALDDPRIVRMDVKLTPHVDVVGDAHCLPFRDGSLAFVFATAVFEHLERPFDAAAETWRVLVPGGHVFADCAFVFPYHGFPAVYFNASLEGMRSLFAAFTEVHAFVAPWQMPSFALKAVLGEYLRQFEPTTGEGRAFVQALEELQRFPVEAFDRDFTPAAAARIAASVSFIGAKRLARDDVAGAYTLAPEAVMDAWRADPSLRARYPKPWNLVPLLSHEGPDNLLRWALEEGVETDPAIARWAGSVAPFEKALD